MPIPKHKRVRKAAVKKSIRDLLEALGFNLRNADLRKTPERVANVLIAETFPELRANLFTTFPSKSSSMVTLVNHTTYTRCPHHLERVKLSVSISYLPKGRLLGLSKLARIADYYASGLMLQEEVTEGIAEGLTGALKPKGVAVHIRGLHLCMRARGVKSRDSECVTTFLTGGFDEDPRTRKEFFDTINNYKERN